MKYKQIAFPIFIPVFEKLSNHWKEENSYFSKGLLNTFKDIDE